MNDEHNHNEQASQAANDMMGQGFAQTQAMGENMRQLAEQSVQQSRDFYGRVRSAGEQTTASLETSFQAATQGLRDWNSKVLTSMQTMMDAQFAFSKTLMGVTSVSQAMSLTADHAREQVAAIQAQAQDFQALARQIANDSTGPLKTLGGSLAKAA